MRVHDGRLGFTSGEKMPRFESLEPRLVLSVSVGLVGTQLRVTGDQANNTIIVTLKTLGNDRIRVEVGSVAQEFDLAKVASLKIDLGAGNDKLDVGVLGGGILGGNDKPIPRSVTVTGGAGNDAI